MTDFLDALERAADEPPEPAPARPRTPWDEVLDTFIAFLNRKYADALRAFRRDGEAPGVVQLVVSPRGQRNQQHMILVLHLTRGTARVLGTNSDEIPSVEALEQRLTHMIRMPAFRQTVAELRRVAGQPVTGVLHAGGLRDRRPSTDVVVTIPPEEQIRLADAAEARQQAPLTMHVQLAGPSPVGQGVYNPGTVLRWLVAGGYGLALEAGGGHAPEGGNRVRLIGTPVEPEKLG
jgi:hypothetical protein